MKQLGLSIDLERFVQDLSPSKLSWEYITQNLGRLAKSVMERSNSQDGDATGLMNLLIDEMLTLPVGVCLPLTFAEPSDGALMNLLKPAREFSTFLDGYVRIDIPVSQKLQAIRCQVHLFEIVSNVPLAIGAVVAVAIYRKAVESVAQVLNSTVMSTDESDELRTLIQFSPLAFEQILIGEIGFLYFSPAPEPGMSDLSEWKEMALKNPEMRKTYRRLLVQSKFPFIDPMLRSAQFTNMISCLRDIREKNVDFSATDLSRHIGNSSIRNRVVNKMGGMGNSMIERAFGFRATQKHVDAWLSATLDAMTQETFTTISEKGDWGIIDVSRGEKGIHSHFFLQSFFGNSLEYVLHPPQQTA